MWGLTPNGLFVDKNNAVYSTDPSEDLLYAWYNDSSFLIRTWFDDLYEPYGLFVLSKDDIYVAHGDDGRVNKWKATTTDFETVTQFCHICHAIFIDTNNMMYCSVRRYHQIIKKPLHSDINMTIVVAGVGFKGSEPYMLNGPYGIFVSINFDLYVADAGNDRIQLFRSGEVNGTTIAGTHDTFELSEPSGVVLDLNDYIYIVDKDNHRIVAKTPYGFRCIVACTGAGDSSDKLTLPFSMAFDSFGNIYIADETNERVQKFLLSKNKCGKFGIDVEISRSSLILL